MRYALSFIFQRVDISSASWIPLGAREVLLALTDRHVREGHLIVRCMEGRSQEENVARCLSQLRKLVQDAVTVAQGGKTKGEIERDKVRRRAARAARRRKHKLGEGTQEYKDAMKDVMEEEAVEWKEEVGEIAAAVKSGPVAEEKR